jgi:hypothetical protein
MTPLSLWVLEGVLTDYSDGIVCVLARDEIEAWSLLRGKDRVAWSYLREYPDDPDGQPLDDYPKRFRRVDAPEAFVLWGGA